MKNGKNKRRIAVFDIDGTIFRSSLIIQLVDELIAEGAFPRGSRHVFGKQYTDWLNRKDSYEKYIDAVVKVYLKYIKGVHQPAVWRCVERLMKYHKDRVYRFSRDLIRDLKKKGYVLVAISNSPLDIVQPFAFGMGFDKVYGRVYEIDGKERFTGKILYADLISDKAKVLRRAATKYHLTLKDSIGVGDTEADIPMLKAVDRPIAFNPNQALYRVARKNKWQIVVERKDVVYTL